MDALYEDRVPPGPDVFINIIKASFFAATNIYRNNAACLYAKPFTVTMNVVSYAKGEWWKSTVSIAVRLSRLKDRRRVIVLTLAGFRLTASGRKPSGKHQEKARKGYA